MRSTRDADAADDPLQETFVRLLGETAAGRPPVRVRALLFAAHGYSGAELAAHIGSSEPATRSPLSRHRGRLRGAPEAA